MNIKALAIAGALVAGTAGVAFAQTAVDPTAPVPTGGIGNTNTGPGARLQGETMPGTSVNGMPTSTGSILPADPGPAPGSITSDMPSQSGSIGNTNTGPGARPYKP